MLGQKLVMKLRVLSLKGIFLNMAEVLVTPVAEPGFETKEAKINFDATYYTISKNVKQIKSKQSY